jgi:hypothetical protein
MTDASFESALSALTERRYKWPNRFFHTFEAFPQVRRRSRFAISPFGEFDATLGSA